MTRRIAQVNWVLVAIVALGTALRLAGIGYGLPYTLNPDEPTYLTVTLQILKTGDLNPHWWYYPSLMFYLNAAVFLLYFLIGRAVGVFSTPADIPLPEVITMGVGKLAMPSEFIVARGLVALFGVGIIVLVYLIARRLHPNRWVALIAALFCAVSYTLVDLSYRIGPDIFALFFALASFYFALRIADEPNMRNYLLAGSAAGLAIASKYNAGVILVALAAAHWLKFGFSGLRRRELYFALAAAGLAFLIATPFAVLDFPGFWWGVRFQAFSYSAEGHAGQEGDALRWYVTYLWETESWIGLGALIGGLLALGARRKQHWLLLSYPVVYFSIVSLMFVRNARTISQIIPFLDLLAALAIVSSFEYLVRTKRVARRVGMVACGATVALFTVLPLQAAYGANLRATRLDDRETARVWIEQNLPAGARIALEAYAPYVDTRRFTVNGEYSLVDHEPEWYVANGFEYLVFSYGAYGRYFEDPTRYSEFVSRYETFFSQFPEIARFDTLGFPIRIYKTNPPKLPATRVAARLGLYAPWLELVGYDWQPPRLTMYWRGLQTRRESFRLTARLLDRDGAEITQFSADAFSASDLKSQAMFQVPWTLVAPTEYVPGAYRLQLELDADGVGRVPILSTANQTVSDKLFLGPLKFSLGEPSAAEWQAARPVGAKFGEAISLQRFSIASGKALSVTLYWQSAARVDKDYTVFVQLLDANGSVRAQSDAMPAAGRYPTSVWDAGEIVRDHHALDLPPDFQPGQYNVIVGLYEYPSLVRLRVSDASGNELGDHLILDEVALR
ncbi:MAG: glycosyltransferase family 39 protein [Chloroflexi bacterium]|nr:glycosyltransferase family 39 protein [Chloroflexota bacterium]